MTPANLHKMYCDARLPDLYARVVAKRPELAVKALARDLSVYNESLLTPDGLIADSILAKWVKALPCGGHLVHGHGTGASVQWRVELPERPMLLPSSPTPLEALAAFWLEYQP